VASVILSEIMADGERLGITQLLETSGVESTVAGVWICTWPAEASGPPLSQTLLIIPPQVRGGTGRPDSRWLSAPLSRGNLCCAAVSEALEIPQYLRRFSEKTRTTVFASRFDAWLLKSRLIGLFGEKGERRITVHGVLVQVSGIGVLITGESGIGKTACGLELARSGGGWVADDAVVLEGRGDALYGRGHKRTKGLIALCGRGIRRAEWLLGAEALRDTTRVEVIVRMRRGFKGEDIAGSGAQRSVRNIVGVPLPCWRLVAGDEPRRMAERVREIVREFLDGVVH
jgi:serine kinase of HPr protein (carbohydrate metabolism regulator)